MLPKQRQQPRRNLRPLLKLCLLHQTRTDVPSTEAHDQALCVPHDSSLQETEDRILVPIDGHAGRGDSFLPLFGSVRRIGGGTGTRARQLPRLSQLRLQCLHPLAHVRTLEEVPRFVPRFNLVHALAFHEHFDGFVQTIWPKRMCVTERNEHRLLVRKRGISPPVPSVILRSSRRVSKHGNECLYYVVRHRCYLWTIIQLLCQIICPRFQFHQTFARSSFIQSVPRKHREARLPSTVYPCFIQAVNLARQKLICMFTAVSLNGIF